MKYKELTEDQKDQYITRQYEQLGSDDIYSWIYDILAKDNEEINDDVDMFDTEEE